MNAATAVSAGLVTLFGLLIIAADSFWLVAPHSVAAKLKDANMMRTLYGAQSGMKHMDKFDGWFMIVLVFTAIISGWFPYASGSLVSMLCLFAIHPTMLYVGVCMAVGGLLPGLGPILFVVMSSVFGANAVWRALEPSLFVEPKFVPLAVAWHLVCMGIFLSYMVRALQTTPKIKYSIKLGLMHEEAVNGGAKWIRGNTEPEGFVDTLGLKEKAAAEQEAVDWIPYWRTFLGIFVTLAALGGGLAGVAAAPDLGSNPRSYAYVSLTIVSLCSVGLLYFVIMCNQGGFGRKALAEGFEKYTPTEDTPLSRT